MTTARQRFCDRVLALWREGITLSPETLHYMESTFQCAEPRRVGELLHDPSGCEAAALLELLFFPDEAVQLLLTECIARCRFDEGDQTAIIAHLQAQGAEATFRFPTSTGVLIVPVPREAVAAWVGRMRITRRLPEEMETLIAERFAGKTGDRMRVRLRNTPLRWTPERTRLLTDLLGSMSPEDPELLPCLDFCVACLEEAPDDTDPLSYLRMKRNRCRQLIAEDRERERQEGPMNMETRVLLGLRVPYVDHGRLGAQMRLCDSILFRLGEPGLCPPAPRHRDMGGVHSEEGIRSFIRRNMEG